MLLISMEALKLISWLLFFGIQKNNPLLMELEKTNVPLLVFDIQQNLNLKLTSAFSFKSRGGLEEVKAVKSKFFFKVYFFT